MNKNTKLGLTFLAGVAAGVVAGILLAPDKGSETRRKMEKKAREFSDNLKEKANSGLQFANKFKESVSKEFVE